jgi:predicted nucleic acid-binding protein
MAGRIFIDTNILVYAFSGDPRNTIARRLLAGEFDLAVQSLNEFANVSTRKLSRDWETVEGQLAAIIDLATTIHPLTLDIHLRGIALAERLQLQVYDAMLLATALKAGCTEFLSEDMQDGLIIENSLTICNPFA